MATISISNMLIAFPSNIPPKLLHSPSSSSSLPSLTRNTPTALINTRKPTVITTCCKATKTQTLTPTPPKLRQADVSSVWRKLHGEENWAGLLDPMDPLMRAELIRYGEMAQACYDSFDYDPYSKYCGSCRYLPEEFFSALDMAHLGYSVTCHLYATANIKVPGFIMKMSSRWPDKMWSNKANWVGYVAVSDDETSKKLGRRDITVAWRGTITHTEWVADFEYSLKSITPEIHCSDNKVMVEAGFLALYTDREPGDRFTKYSVRQQVLSEVKRLVDKYQDEEVSITMTGHSLGSALATLSAFDIAQTGLNVKKNGGARVHVSALTFAGPRLGNSVFKERLEALGVKVLRVINKSDLVPNCPGYFFNTEAWYSWLTRSLPKSWVYSHVGLGFQLDDLNSPYLDPKLAYRACRHNLEAHLHLLDGYRGRNVSFESATGRDVALVNKSCDFVKDENLVPPMWWQDLNKGLVKGSDGHWKQKERNIPDFPKEFDHYIKQLGI